MLVLVCQIYVLRNDALLHQLGGISTVNSIRDQVFGGHGARRQNRMGTESHPWTNPAIGSNPDAIFQLNRTDDQIKRSFFVIVAASTEKGALGNADITANDYAFQIQQPAFLAQPDMIADGQLPWKSDVDLGLDGNIASDIGPKRP
jgi:hypothetical protein